MLVIKIVPSVFENENRDLREISVLHDLGCDVIVVAKGGSDGVCKREKYDLHRITSRPLSSFTNSIFINRICSFFTWTRYVRRLHGDILSCHDLICLVIGWLSIIGLKNKPKLVYDSHEFEVERNVKRNKVERYIVKSVERFLMNKASLNLMVNDSIADAVQSLHHLVERPIVVRNLPSLWVIDESVCQLKRMELCKMYSVPVDSFLMMYHGGVTFGRGIENIIQTIAKLDNVILIILGNGQDVYRDKLECLTKQLSVQSKVFFHPAVNHSILWQYIGAADVDVCVLLNTCKSYYYALPNKLFESIQTETPVIVSNFPEMERIVNKYEIGICCDPNSIDELVQAVGIMRENRCQYTRFKKNALRAKADLCWEREKDKLEQAYLELLNK